MATSKGKTNAELVAEYNALGPAKPLKAWKGKKSVLIDKINAAKKQRSSTSKPAKNKKASKSSGNKRTGEIRDVCETMLQAVMYHENKDKPVGDDNQLQRPGKNTRPVGMPFSAILNEVRATFPDANTSYACLRWYAVHLRHAGVTLPRRPKSSWK